MKYLFLLLFVVTINVQSQIKAPLVPELTTKGLIKSSGLTGKLAKEALIYAKTHKVSDVSYEFQQIRNSNCQLPIIHNYLYVKQPLYKNIYIVNQQGYIRRYTMYNYRSYIEIRKQ